MRVSKSFTIDEEIGDYVDTSKGKRSASDRVNELLRLGIQRERDEDLRAEAAEFFAQNSDDRAETRAFQSAAMRSHRRG